MKLKIGNIIQTEGSNIVRRVIDIDEDYITYIRYNRDFTTNVFTNNNTKRFESHGWKPANVKWY